LDDAETLQINLCNTMININMIGHDAYSNSKLKLSKFQGFAVFVGLATRKLFWWFSANGKMGNFLPDCQRTM